MALMENPIFVSPTTTVFKSGKFSVKPIAVETSDISSPPAPLLICTPKEDGEYPILIFLHGFLLSNSCCLELLTHIASHGFIVVAPQLYYLLPNPHSCQGEIDTAAKVTEWLCESLPSVLPANVKGNFSKLGLVGHSRGGKSAFCLAKKDSDSFSVLIGIDPVAGDKMMGEVAPKILEENPHSFNIRIPVLVFGTDLESCGCTPEGMNHKNFYERCKAPCYHVTTKEYGHVDMLDDIKQWWHPANLCKKGSSAKEPMRSCVGGIVVAFLNAYMKSENGDLKAILAKPAIAPVTLDRVEYIEA